MADENGSTDCVNYWFRRLRVEKLSAPCSTPLPVKRHTFEDTFMLALRPVADREHLPFVTHQGACVSNVGDGGETHHGGHGDTEKKRGKELDRMNRMDGMR